MTDASASTPAPITDAGAAEEAIARLNAIMDDLTATIEEETAHLRAGRVRAAVALEPAKAEFARDYARETARLKAAGALVAKTAPEALAALSGRHTALRTLLQTNLTVLATAHAVSEGIIRGVCSELTRKNAPSTYGATGSVSKPPAKAGQPLAVCRTL